jgi:hypothetical protein
MPIFIERFPNAHGVNGGNVVYADGRCEWIKWGEKWPMTPEAMDVLLALDAPNPIKSCDCSRMPILSI